MLDFLSLALASWVGEMEKRGQIARAHGSIKAHDDDIHPDAKRQAMIARPARRETLSANCHRQLDVGVSQGKRAPKVFHFKSSK